MVRQIEEAGLPEEYTKQQEGKYEMASRGLCSITKCHDAALILCPAPLSRERAVDGPVLRSSHPARHRVTLLVEGIKGRARRVKAMVSVHRFRGESRGP